MGYSGRYHLASLVAVFVALAIGILIGIGLAGDVVTTASEELKESLRRDLNEANDEVDSLAEDLGRERQFSSLAYPALVNQRLEGRRVGLISLGEPSEELVTDVRSAVEPAGAELSWLTAIAMPPDAVALLGAAGPRFAAANELSLLEQVGTVAGEQLASGGGPLLDRLAPVLFSRAGGQPAGVKRFVIARADLDGFDENATAQSTALQRGLIKGLNANVKNLVGIERASVEPSLLEPLTDAGIPTVDHVNLIAGRVSLVFALLGAEGDYGIKDEDDQYLPALVDSAIAAP